MSLLITGTIGFGIGVIWGVAEGYLNRKLDKENRLEIDFKEVSEQLKHALNLYTEEEIKRLTEEEKEYNSKLADTRMDVQSIIQKVQSEIDEVKRLNTDIISAEHSIDFVKEHITGTTYSVKNPSGKTFEMTDDELDPYLDSIILRNYTISVKLEKLLDIYEFISHELLVVRDKKCIPECFGTCNTQGGEMHD